MGLGIIALLMGLGAAGAGAYVGFGSNVMMVPLPAGLPAAAPETIAIFMLLPENEISPCIAHPPPPVSRTGERGNARPRHGVRSVRGLKVYDVRRATEQLRGQSARCPLGGRNVPRGTIARWGRLMRRRGVRRRRFSIGHGRPSPPRVSARTPRAGARLETKWGREGTPPWSSRRGLLPPGPRRLPRYACCLGGSAAGAA